MNLGLLLIGGAVFVVVLGGLVTAMTAPQRAAFQTRGIATNAEITNLRTGLVKGWIGSSTAYYVDYTYFVALPGYENVRQGGYHQIDQGTHARLQVGETIQIRYL